MTEAVGLCSLPVELQNFIALNLDPSTAVALRQTNRWFHTHVSLHRLNRIDVRNYLHNRELQPHNDDYYACFSCLDLKPSTAFTTFQIGTKLSNGNGYSYQRYCLDCGIRNGKHRQGTSLRMGGPKSKPMILCGVCTSVQAYFCEKCLCCSGCIISMRTWTGRAAHLSQRGNQTPCLGHFQR